MKSAHYVVRSLDGDGGVVSRRFGRETLLVPVCAGVGDLDNVYTLNEAGTAIWETIAAPTEIAKLAAMVAAEYEVTPDVARGDVDSFLADLAELGLVNLTSASVPAIAGEGERL